MTMAFLSALVFWAIVIFIVGYAAGVLSTIVIAEASVFMQRRWKGTL